MSKKTAALFLSISIAGQFAISVAHASDKSMARVDNYDCPTIRTELQKVATRVVEITGSQQSHGHDEDASALTPPLVVYWDQVLFSANDEERKLLLPLRNRYRDLQKKASDKKCMVAQELESHGAALQ